MANSLSIQQLNLVCRRDLSWDLYCTHYLQTNSQRQSTTETVVETELPGDLSQSHVPDVELSSIMPMMAPTVSWGKV